MNPLDKATAMMEAATEADLAHLCGVERLYLQRQLYRWTRLLEAKAPRRADDAPKAGILAELQDGARPE